MGLNLVGSDKLELLVANRDMLFTNSIYVLFQLQNRRVLCLVSETKCAFDLRFSLCYGWLLMELPYLNKSHSWVFPSWVRTCWSDGVEE